MSTADPRDGSGYLYLGPTTIPPLVPAVGMVDEVTGTTYYLSWNGTNSLRLQTTLPPGLQNHTIYKPHDGPWLPFGRQLGVNNGSAVVNLQLNPKQPNRGGPILAFNYNSPLAQSYPEPTNYPAPGTPTTPGIPSSTPPPTGGGYSAFLAAFSTNKPTLVTLLWGAGEVYSLVFYVGGVATAATFS